MANIKDNVQIYRMQNAQKIVDVKVMNKPRKPFQPAPSNFVRDCPLKSEIEKKKRANSYSNREKQKPIVAVKENKKSKYINLHNDSSLPPGMSWSEFLHKTHSKYSQNYVSEEKQKPIVAIKENKKSKYINLHNDSSLPPGMTWSEFLHKTQNSQNSVSDASNEYSKQIVKRNVDAAVNHKIHFENSNKSVQTKTLPVRYLQLNSEKPYEAIPKVNMDENTDHTHTPFGASAMELINQIRERFRSVGDSVGSEMVNQFEAYIEGSGSGNRVKSMGKDTVFAFSPLSRHKEVQTSMCNTSVEESQEIEKLKQIIKEQDKKIIDLEYSSEQLTALCEKLISCCQRKAKEAALQHDKEKTVHHPSADVNYERDFLIEKIDRYANIISDLEKKLRLYTHNDCIPTNSVEAKCTSEIPKNSEVDSAFDDKTVSCSSSKITSPVLNYPSVHVLRENFLSQIIDSNRLIEANEKCDSERKKEHFTVPSYYDLRANVPNISNFSRDSIDQYAESANNSIIMVRSNEESPRDLTEESENISLRLRKVVLMANVGNQSIINCGTTDARNLNALDPKEERQLEISNYSQPEFRNGQLGSKEKLQGNIVEGSQDYFVEQSFPPAQLASEPNAQKVLESTRISMDKSKSCDSFKSVNEEDTAM